MAPEAEPMSDTPQVEIVDHAVDANAPHGENPELIDEDDER